MPYTDNLALVSETLEVPKERLKTWKGALESEGLRANIKKIKMMISNENVGKITIEGKFPCIICRKRVSSNSIFCQLCRWWMHKRCSGFEGKLKVDSKFKCQTCINQQTDRAKDSPCIKLNDQSLEIVEKFCYLGDTVGARRGQYDSIITRIKSEWCKFRDLVPLRFALRN